MASHLSIVKIRSDIEEPLLRVVSGGKITREESYAFMQTDDDELEALMRAAAQIRDEKKGKYASYSRKIFLPLTNMCRNRCGYCGFRREPTHPEAKIMTQAEVLKVVEAGRKAGCKEALFTLGERPEEMYPEVRQMLRQLGYDSTFGCLRNLCELVIKNGLLPHSNPGILNKEEMRELKDVNASMGLMLENVSERLCLEGGPHEFSPGKSPKLRLATIEYAGQLKIPFTTGLLIGIGETLEERVDSLFAIKHLHEEYEHIQEVIIQNFKVKTGTSMENHPEPVFTDLLRTMAVARLILGGEMNLQAPPNLSPAIYPSFLFAGANDFGGISPVTVDFVNPEAPWPVITDLKRKVADAGFQLKERLPIYPEYIVGKKGFIPAPLKEQILSLVDWEGYVKESFRYE